MQLLAHPLVQCMICAWGFGGWSIMMKLFEVRIGWAMLLVTIAQFGAALVLLRLSPEVSAIRNMAQFALFGAIPNAVAIVSMGFLLRQKGEVITTWVPVMNAMMLLIGVFGGAFFLAGETLTLRKVIGVASICFGIYVISSR